METHTHTTNISQQHFSSLDLSLVHLLSTSINPTSTSTPSHHQLRFFFFRRHSARHQLWAELDVNSSCRGQLWISRFPATKRVNFEKKLRKLRVRWFDGLMYDTWNYWTVSFSGFLDCKEFRNDSLDWTVWMFSKHSSQTTQNRNITHPWDTPGDVSKAALCCWSRTNLRLPRPKPLFDDSNHPQFVNGNHGTWFASWNKNKVMGEIFCAWLPAGRTASPGKALASPKREQNAKNWSQSLKSAKNWDLRISPTTNTNQQKQKHLASLLETWLNTNRMTMVTMAPCRNSTVGSCKSSKPWWQLQLRIHESPWILESQLI